MKEENSLFFNLAVPVSVITPTTTLLLERTGDPDLVQRLMGWSNQVMIKRYGHLSNRAKDAFKSLEESFL